jgi:hypothetical protein
MGHKCSVRILEEVRRAEEREGGKWREEEEREEGGERRGEAPLSKYGATRAKFGTGPRGPMGHKCSVRILKR